MIREVNMIYGGCGRVQSLEHRAATDTAVLVNYFGKYNGLLLLSKLTRGGRS